MNLFNESMLADWDGGFVAVAWKSLVILTLVFAAVALCRRSPATLRHWIWTMAFVCLLALPVFVRYLPAMPPPVWINSHLSVSNFPDSLKYILGNAPGQNDERPNPVSPAQNTAAAASSAASQKVSSQASPVPSPVFGWRKVLLAIWLAVMTVGLMRILFAQVQLRRMGGTMRICENPVALKILDTLRSGYWIRRPVKLLISEAAVTPMTWGFWRPIIALPTESIAWSDERLRAVLRHELAHVKRQDCLTQEIAHITCALYWFNPLVWLAARRMRVEREKACDDLVLNAGTRPVAYANHLVEIARQFSTAQFGGAVAMARPSGLEQRVTAILDDRRDRNAIGKMTVVLVAAAVFVPGLLIGGCSKTGPQKPWSLEDSPVHSQLKAFVAEKEAQERQLQALDEKDYFKHDPQLKVPDCQPFFAAAAKGDWQAMSNLLSEMGLSRGATNRPYYQGRWKAPVGETFGAIEAFAAGDEKYSQIYGDEIIQSIPPGSVYFGGTDAGRFIVTALQKSQVTGDPFFTLTQNALADESYLAYLRSMYGDNIYVPTAADSQKCFEDYESHVAIRFQKHQLKADENYQQSGGRIQISGMGAVMQINGLLVKVIFDHSPNREFYIEESWPLDWMYPYLEPHGLIFKINRQPLNELSDEIVQRDHDYWAKIIQPMIGDWLNDDTSVQEITDFAKKIFLQHDFSGFAGDPQFIENAYSCKMFSKERASIADLYVWRMNQAATSGEKEQMARAADFAYRQALALCPYSSEAANGYESFLKSRNLDANAALIEAMAAQFPKPK
jgi:beta-lactamase regulating signal transducer with metallopeptidase domain